MGWGVGGGGQRCHCVEVGGDCSILHGCKNTFILLVAPLEDKRERMVEDMRRGREMQKECEFEPEALFTAQRWNTLLQAEKK